MKSSRENKMEIPPVFTSSARTAGALRCARFGTRVAQRQMCRRAPRKWQPGYVKPERQGEKVMKKKKEHQGQNSCETVSGVLVPGEWDDNGRLTGMILSAFDDEEYRIENSQKFLELADQHIEASGCHPAGPQVVSHHQY